MRTVEYRVRPVERFIVTKYESTESAGGSSLIGEYPNAQTALLVKNALETVEGKSILPMEFPLGSFDDAQFDAAKKYAVVAFGFDIQTMAFYARGIENANEIKAFAEQKYGGQWDIFEKA